MELEGTLQIKVLKAELLNDTDYFGKMDPYVILKLNDQSFQTTVKKSAGKTPQWYETFAFRAKEGESIRLDVLDKDFLKHDDLVGSGVYEIKDIFSPNKNIIIKLYRKGSKYSGELFLESKFFPDPNEYSKMIGSLQKQINNELEQIEKLQKELRNTNKLIELEENQKNRKGVIIEACAVDDRKSHLEEEFKKLEHGYELQIQEVNLSIQSYEKTITLMNANIDKAHEYVNNMKNEIEIYKNPPENGKIFIHCIEGSFNRTTKTFGQMEPFSIFSLKNSIFKTKKVKGDKNPLWDEKFELSRENQENLLRVEAYNEKDLIGYGFINLNWIIIRGMETNTQIKLLFNKDGLKEVGYINIVVKYEK